MQSFLSAPTFKISCFFHNIGKVVSTINSNFCCKLQIMDPVKEFLINFPLYAFQSTDEHHWDQIEKLQGKRPTGYNWLILT